MRHFIELLPTIVLLGIIGVSLYIKFALNGKWINLFVLGISGLFIYSPFILFADGMYETYSRKMAGKVKTDLRLKLFQYYLLTLWIMTLLIGIYSMNHN